MEGDEPKKDSVLHISLARINERIARMGQGGPCGREDCPGPDNWEAGYGLAGGGIGLYLYCGTCEEVKEKDPEEDSGG